jgi:hypothetical protein
MESTTIAEPSPDARDYIEMGINNPHRDSEMCRTMILSTKLGVEEE